MCKAAAREAGEKLATPRFLFAKTRISQQTVTVPQKTLHTQNLSHLFPFYPSGKKYQVKGSIKLVKTKGCSSLSASSITADTAGNAELSFSWIINTFYIWHWLPVYHYCINTSAQKYIHWESNLCLSLLSFFLKRPKNVFAMMLGSYRNNPHLIAASVIFCFSQQQYRGFHRNVLLFCVLSHIKGP